MLMLIYRSDISVGADNPSPGSERSPVTDGSKYAKRSFTQKKATGYGLTGWVRNTDGGKVSRSSLHFSGPAHAW